MKKAILLSLILLFVVTVFSQEDVSKANIYLELGGAGMLTSINYEQKVWARNNNALNLRAGVGYFPLIVNTKMAAGTYSLIVGANFLKNYRNHHIVVGLYNSFANTFTTRTNRESGNYIFNNLIVPSIGYRYQKTEKGRFFIGVGYSPVISFTGFTISNSSMQYKNYFCLYLGFTI